MTHSAVDPLSQAGTTNALTLARERFRYLTAIGIQGKRDIPGPAIDPDDVAEALQALSLCRHTKRPSIHSSELRRAVSRRAGRTVSTGSVIAAAVGLGFTVRGWYGVRAFYPGAIVNVHRADVRMRLVGSAAPCQT